MGVDHTEKRIVVSFKGTSDLRDWVRQGTGRRLAGGRLGGVVVVGGVGPLLLLLLLLP